MKHALIVFLVLAITVAFAADPEYIGSDRCKICHKKAEKGDQYGHYIAGPHAKAFETLKSDHSKEIAKKMGLKTSPDQAPECLNCHVTGWGSASGYQLSVDPADSRAVKTNTDMARVGCESCHGPGSLYKKKSTMEELFMDKIDGKDLGYTKPDATTCKTCHNEKSPTYKDFDFAVRVKEVMHPYPEGYTIPQD